MSLPTDYGSLRSTLDGTEYLIGQFGTGPVHFTAAALVALAGATQTTWTAQQTFGSGILTKGPVYDAKAYGAKGDGTTNDGTAIAAAISAAPSGGIVYLSAGTYKITSPISIAKPLLLRGDGPASIISQATSGQDALDITSSNVRVDSLKVTGSQYLSSSTDSLISAAGSVNSYLSGITISNVVVTTGGKHGIWLNFVKDFLIAGCNVQNIYHAGVELLSVNYGRVMHNEVDNIIDGTNAYGIAVSRLTDDAGELTTNPLSTDVLVAGNIVKNIPTWEAFDTHGGVRISFVGNECYNCKIGVAVGDCVNHSNVATYPPLYCVVDGNVLDSGVTDGSASFGISVTGTTSSLAVGCSVTGNTVIRYGDSTNANSGALYVRNTVGLSVTGNTFVEPSPHIEIYHDNYGFTFSDNTIIDPWTNSGTIGEAAAVLCDADYNQGTISGNVFMTWTKSATYVLTYGVRVNNQSHNIVRIQGNYQPASVLDYDPGVHTYGLVLQTCSGTPSDSDKPPGTARYDLTNHKLVVHEGSGTWKSSQAFS